MCRLGLESLVNMLTLVICLTDYITNIRCQTLVSRSIPTKNCVQPLKGDFSSDQSRNDKLGHNRQTKRARVSTNDSNTEQ